MSYKKKPIDFNAYKATILRELPILNKRRMVEYRCNICKEPISARLDIVKKSTTGCCNHCMQSVRNYKTPITHGLRKHPDYQRWCDIEKRCFSPRSISYEHYGAKGITIYPAWKDDPEAFHKYISTLEHYGTPKYSLDRIKVDGNYEPGNLRWTTQLTQVTNVNILTKANTSGYRGVSWDKSTMAYRALIQWDKHIEQKHHAKFGFETALKAAQYRDNYIVDNNLPNKLNDIKDQHGNYISRKHKEI